MINLYIQEKNEKWLNFFTPAVLAYVGLSLASFIVFSVLIMNLIVPILSEDSVIANLSVSLVSQLIGAILIALVLIPRFQMKIAAYNPVNGRNTLKTGLIFSVGFLLYIFSNFVFAAIYRILELVPTSAYEEIGILLTPAHLENPLNIILLLGMGVIGAPILEEYIFRRTVIPLLEERGMAPFAAVFASSMIFTIIHAPTDLAFGNLSGTVQHLWAVFIIGMAAGIAYIITRNVVYPIIIHGLFNGMSFGGYLLMLSENIAIAAIFGILVIVILIVGIGSGVYAFKKFRNDPLANWVVLFKEKSSINIVPGFLGFLGIFTILIILQSILELAFWITIPINDLLVGLLISMGITALLVAGLSWLATKTEYIDKSQNMRLVEPKI